jgi:hypothetical protein
MKTFGNTIFLVAFYVRGTCPCTLSKTCCVSVRGMLTRGPGSKTGKPQVATGSYVMRAFTACAPKKALLV